MVGRLVNVERYVVVKFYHYCMVHSCTVGLVNRDKNIHTTQRLFGVGGELLDMEQGDIDICVSG